MLFALPQQSSKLCPGTKIGFSKTDSLPEEDLGVKVLLGRANGVNSFQELELLELFGELAPPCIPKHKCKLCCAALCLRQSDFNGDEEEREGHGRGGREGGREGKGKSGIWTLDALADLVSARVK